MIMMRDISLIAGPSFTFRVLTMSWKELRKQEISDFITNLSVF